MLLCSTSCLWHSVICSYRNNSLYFIDFFKPFISKIIAGPLFFITLLLFFSTAHSQQTSTQISATGIEVANLSAAEMLTKANFFRLRDEQTSSTLANEALQLAKENNNHPVSAQAHSLLGELAKKSKNIDQSIHHFLQASLIYKSINDKSGEIKSSIDYAHALFAKKRYAKADKVIDQLLPLALKYGEVLPIALTLSAKGDGYFQQKHYIDAITQYTDALTYLSGVDKAVLKQRGNTYTSIAQAYKRLKNRPQTASFYKKSLDIFTALHDQKNMARTLNTLAEAERYLGNYVIALNYSTQGLEIHKQLDDPIGHAKALVGAGIIYRHIGSYEKSLKHIHQAHQYYQQVNDANGIANTSNQMGLIYTRLKEFDQARSFYQLTIEKSAKKVSAKTLATAYREMAVIYLNAGEYEPSKKMAEKASAIYQRENDSINESIVTRIIGNIYRALHDDTNAITYYRKSLSLAIKIGSDIYQIKAQTPLAGILIGKNTDEAISLLKKSLQLSIKINSIDHKLYTYRELRKAEKSRGNFAESLRYAEQEIALTKIIQQQREDNELVLIKAKLHSKKLEMELETLKEITELDQLELAKKNSEIEIAGQARIISELELTKNQYASIALASLLAICILAIMFMYRRFTHSRKRNKELHILAARDPLTNCYNRRFLDERLNQDFAQLAHLDEYCIILADIDNFKAVNDNYGHNAGDSVIRGVANILQSGVRQNDIVARFGGEEFCIVLSGTDKDHAMHIAETIRKKIKNSLFDNIAVTCSFGVTSIQFNAKTPKELINQADLALYKSKDIGRDHVTLWTPL